MTHQPLRAPSPDWSSDPHSPGWPPHDRAADTPSPDWPLPDLLRAARAHWDDAPRLRLLLRDLAARPEAEALDLHARVARRLRELPPEPRARVVRRDPAALRPRPAPPPPEPPTPEMAALLRLLELERASGATAREEAASLRRHLQDMRATGNDAALRAQLDAARAEATAAREEARRLAERLAFATALRPAQAAPLRPDPRRPQPDPAYAELGLSPDLPDDLVPVYERALLRHHHPDRADPCARDAATRRFQTVTVAFQRIRKLRGLG